MHNLSEPQHIRLEKLTELTNKKNYKAFLYDCDGTLADNMQAHKSAYKKASAKYGIDLDINIIDELAGWPTVKVAEEISKRYAVALDSNTFAKEKSSIFFEDYIEKTLPIPFVLQHLKNHLRKTHIAVVTGGSRRTVSKTLTVLGIINDIELMVCAGETPRGKPYADPFIAAAEGLHVAPSDCIVFEDGDPGVQGAIAAGMDWVRIDQI